GGHGLDGVVEGDLDRRRAARDEPRPDRRMAVADANARALDGRPGPAHVVGDEPARGERAPRPDTDRARRRVDPRHPARDAVADAEAAALADREAMHAAV